MIRRRRPARRTAETKPARRATSWRRGRRLDPMTWLTRHLQVMVSSLGRLVRAPAGTLMTVGVIGIAMALPAGLHLLVRNIEAASGPLDGAAGISLFMHAEVADEAARNIGRGLAERPEIATVEFVGRDEALAEFRSFSGFGEALDLLGENPLPAVVLVRPAAEHGTPERARALAESLQDLPEVELAQLDLQWLRRLQAMTATAQRGIAVLAVLLALAVLLIVGNTIRLEIQNRRPEIDIVRLVGATDGFIRRPFLYTGVWYGFFGGLVAWLLLLAGLYLMRGPVERLAGLYETEFTLFLQSPGILLALFVGGPLLGWVGAWSVVGRQLAATDPE